MDAAPICRFMNVSGTAAGALRCKTLRHRGVTFVADARGDASTRQPVGPPHCPPEKRNPRRNLISPFRGALGVTNSFCSGIWGATSPGGGG